MTLSRQPPLRLTLEADGENDCLLGLSELDLWKRADGAVPGQGRLRARVAEASGNRQSDETLIYANSYALLLDKMGGRKGFIELYGNEYFDFQ